MITFSRLFRAYGVRRPELMVAPPLPVLSRFTFPFCSVYHYLGAGVGDLGPSENDPIIAAQPSLSAIEHVDQLVEAEGNPRRLPMSITMLARKHRQLNQRFAPLKRLEVVAKNDRTLIAFNYSFLDSLYRYPRTRTSTKLRNQNKLATVFAKATNIAGEIEHHQFLMIDLPEFIPSREEMLSATRSDSPTNMQRFSEFNSYFIWQLWLWMGKLRSESIFTRLDGQALKNMNIVFRDAGRFTLLNLGTMDAWRKMSEEELESTQEEDPERRNGKREKLSMQVAYLGMLVRMTEARNAELPEGVTDVDSPSEGELGASVPAEEPQIDSSNSLSDEDGTEAESTAEQIERDISALDTIGSQTLTDIEELEDEEIADIVTKSEDNSLPRQVMGVRHTTGDQKIQQYRDERDEAEQLPQVSGFIQTLDEIADSGGLSAAEYRRLSEQADVFASLKAPNGKPLGEFATVKPDETVISKVAEVPDTGNVIDKSMLKTTLLDFTNRYVSEFLQRDVAGMVVNLQNAGVLVKDYQVEEVTGVLGDYYSYSVNIKPIQGQPSVLHFRLPKVNDEGQFIVNGTKYYMRMQRGDLPIRKINASRVALTSYYGKVFIDRSSRKVHSYGRWITDQIRAMAMDEASDVITHMVPGNVFENDARLPRTYTQLSAHFQTLTTRVHLKVDSQEARLNINFNFDFKNRLKMVGDVPPTGLENLDQGRVLVGTTDTGAPVLLDHEGLLVTVKSEQGHDFVRIGDFTTAFGLEGKNVPLDFAEMMVFGKAIPVGIILAYYLGLKKLVRTLRITPRVVPTGKRVNLLPSEWAIYFEDETWVFERKDRMACMVLGGWRDYNRSAINFPAHEFDRKEVYQPLLESKQLGSRYVREMDLLKQMFIDPITNRLLIRLKEPTTWVGLVTRACELLLTDQHPQEMDSSFMRIKGYERMSGAVYAELIRGLRTHNARGNKTRYKIDHNPYAVWMAIAQDPSKEQVSETNPIQDLKEREAVTYSGTGGRSSRTMSKRTRIYPESDLGVISESTVDSSDVGVNIYTSANPQFNCLEGIADRYDPETTGPSSLLSTSALISPASDQDDKSNVRLSRNG